MKIELVFSVPFGAVVWLPGRLILKDVCGVRYAKTQTSGYFELEPGCFTYGTLSFCSTSYTRMRD